MQNKKLNREKLNELSYEEKLDYFCHLNNLVTFSNSNSKTGASVLTLNLPSQVSCRSNAPCRKFCYCLKGTQCFASVLGAYYKNWRIYQENPKSFFEQVSNTIKFSGLPKVRLFAAGDFPDMNFLEQCVKLANKHKKVKFLAFTKRYEFVNEFISNGGIIPKNFTIIFSSWSKGWKFDNPYYLPIAYVEFNDEKMRLNIPDDTFHCPGACGACGKCWGLKSDESVTFHQH